MGAVDPNADLSAVLAGLSPQDLINRYAWLSDKGQDPYGVQDANNLFAFNLARQTLGRIPKPSEVVSGLGTLTASNVANILAQEQAQAAATSADATVSTAPPNQSAPNSDSAATGMAAPMTSSPSASPSPSLDLFTAGGTPASYASMYSYGGSAPTTFAAPPSDNTGTILAVLAGAVILYMTVLKHG